MKHRVVQ